MFALAGRLFRADLVHGDVVEVAAVGPVLDPRPDPTGQRLAYVTDAADGVRRGELRVIDPDGTDTLLAGEDAGVTWGLAEHIAAEEFGRYRGYWWAPDGRSVLAARVDESRLDRWHLHDPAEPASPPTAVAYPRAGGPNAEVSLHLLDLDDGWVDVHWDRETYPYLTAVSWAEGSPLITVLRRSQQHGLVLAVDPRTGETQVHAELADPRWVEPIAGTPRAPAGRPGAGRRGAGPRRVRRPLPVRRRHPAHPAVAVRPPGGRSAARPAPARPTCWWRRATASRASGTCSGSAPRIGGGVDARRLTTDSGWHTAAVGGDVLVVGVASLDHAGVRWTVRRGDREVAELRVAGRHPAVRAAAAAGTGDRPAAAGGGALPATTTSTGRRLPVLLDIYGGPGHQEVRGGAGRAGWSGSGGPTPGSRWSPSTTGVRRAWRRRSRRRSTGGSPT